LVTSSVVTSSATDFMAATPHASRVARTKSRLRRGASTVGANHSVALVITHSVGLSVVRTSAIYALPAAGQRQTFGRDAVEDPSKLKSQAVGADVSMAHSLPITGWTFMPLIPPESRQLELVVVGTDALMLAEPFEALVGRAVELSIGDGRGVGRVVVASVMHRYAVLSADRPMPTESLRALCPGQRIAFGWGNAGLYFRVDAHIERQLSASALLVACQWPPVRVERRRYRRVDMPGAVDIILFDTPTERVSAPLVNISLGGIAVGAGPLPSGETIGLVLRLPNCAEPVVALAEVVHTEANSISRMRFDVISPSGEDNIASVINRYSTSRAVGRRGHDILSALSVLPSSGTIASREHTRYEVQQPAQVILPDNPSIVAAAITVDVSKGGAKLAFVSPQPGLRARQEVILHYETTPPITALARTVNVEPDGVVASFMLLSQPPELASAMERLEAGSQPTFN
jgi:c-di-GMP-binding flagellar brake protein YcgR